MARRPTIKIKNFEEYQHYKHRNPPWIKLHLSLLDDPDFLRLPDASKWHYIGLLLLASRHGNDILNDPLYISNRLGITEKLDLSKRFLKEHVLASNASVLPTNADSEKSRDRDRVEIESATLAASPPIKQKRVLRSISEEDKPTDKHMALGQQIGVNVPAEWAKFKNYCLAHDKRYANFEAAFRNWIVNSEHMKGGVHVVR